MLNDDGSIDPESPNLTSGLVQCGAGGVPTGCAKGHLFNPAPRIGFAWDPWGNGKTAIRGGYGIFFEHTNGNEAVATALEGSPPLVQNPSQQSIGSTFDANGNIVTSGYSLVGGGELGAQFPQSIVSIPTKQVWPYVQQWHLDVQHELPYHIVTTVSYVGSKGTHLGERFDLNQIRPVAANANPYAKGQPFTGVILTDGTVQYPGDCESGTAGVGGPVIPGYTPGGDPAAQTPGSPGVNMYVACGNNPDFFRPFLGYSDIRRAEKYVLRPSTTVSSCQPARRSGRCKLRPLIRTPLARRRFLRHQTRASSTLTISIPIVRVPTSISGTFSRSATSTISHSSNRQDGPTRLLGGWQWSGITTVQTGTPYSVTNAGDGGAIPGDNAGVANGTGTGSRPDLIGDPNAEVSGSGPETWVGRSLVPCWSTPGHSPRRKV